MPEKKSPRNILSAKDILNSFKREMLRRNLGQRINQLKNDLPVYIARLKKIGNIAKNNYELGKKHYSLGNFEDAVLRFKFVTWLEAEDYNAWYWLGISYMALGKRVHARNALKRALQIRPDFQEARDMLKAAAAPDVKAGNAEPD